MVKNELIFNPKQIPIGWVIKKRNPLLNWQLSWFFSLSFVFGIIQWKSKYDLIKLYMKDTCTCKLSWLRYQAIYYTSQITLQRQAFEHKLINVIALASSIWQNPGKTCKFIVTHITALQRLSIKSKQRINKKIQSLLRTVQTSRSLCC